MSRVDFVLPEEFTLDCTGVKVILRIARRLAEIRFGNQMATRCPSQMGKGGAIILHPKTGAHRLYPPGKKADQPKGHWRLTSSCDAVPKLRLIVETLCCFPESI
ncbi:MAG: hypothetical protein KBC83_01770 [Candidatus Moranbacteria bacterium]|jgi:hypothetical protein|nr:hypothetical protein [Candidatus Moranbacteria bacterium]MBP9801377.1 hypothetical protein [Candidatus Moranbacteria bacterium]